MRDLFLLDPDLIFLNHGSFGACPAEVLAAYQGWQGELERNPVAFLGRRSAGLLAEARARLAAVLGARPGDLLFVTNATSGVNLVARSLPLAAGDEILTTDHEYGACDNTWDWVCVRTGARIVRAEIPLPFEAEAFEARVWAGVTERTKVLFLSHITSTTALRFPLEGLVRRARAAGILTLIDGAHAPGQLDLDLEALGADFYTGNCHKWLCAPKGAAFLHARPERQALLEALVVSWGYSHELHGQDSFDAYVGSTLFERRHQWQGTRDLAAFLAVPAALDFLERHDWTEVRRTSRALASETLARACALTGCAPIGRDGDFLQMVPIPVPPGDAEPLRRALYDRFHIEIPVTTHRAQRFIRASFQGYNTPEDADRLLDAMAVLLGEGL